MKLAIHDGNGVNKKSIEFCKKNCINYIIVDGYRADIIAAIKDNNVTHFFWHFHHILPEDILMARNVLFSLEKIGIKVYPNFDTSWYFDDKISEKYILEAINAPIVKSWAFYHKKQAMEWLKNESHFPLVAKLRRGAGSYNVILLKNTYQALKYCRKMFSVGISPAPSSLADIKTKFSVARKNSRIFLRLLKAPNFFKQMGHAKQLFPMEKGYVYFQHFIEGAKCDYRIAIVGEKAWGCLRKVRENDFRASGAGLSIEDPNLIPLDLVKIAFDVKKKLNAQSMSFDFVIDKENIPYIVEISYGFGFDGDDGTFYWTPDLTLIKEEFTIEELLINQLIQS